MMKLRARAMNSLQNKEEGDGVRLDSGEKKNRDVNASYEFASITASPGDEDVDRPKESSTSTVKRTSVHSRSLDQNTSNSNDCESKPACQLSPNTLSTRSFSTDDEADLEKPPKGEAEQRPIPRRGLTRGLSGRKVSGESGRNLTRGLSARNLVMGVGSLRKTFMKEQPHVDEKEDRPDVPEKRGGLFGGGRRKRDQKDDINNHIGEITVSRDKLSGEIKDSKDTPHSLRRLTKSRNGENRKAKKQSTKEKLDSHIGEIKITKRPPSDGQTGEVTITKNPETTGGEIETACHDPEPATITSLDNTVSDPLGNIAEDIEPYSDEETSSTKGTADAKGDCVDSEGVSEGIRDSPSSTKICLSFHSAKGRARKGKSDHGSDVKSKTAHVPSGGQVVQYTNPENNSSSDDNDTFADVTETPDLKNEAGEEGSDHRYVFEGEGEVPRVQRGQCDDALKNEDVIFQFFLEKEHPVVWIETEEAEGPIQHLELNISFATKIVVHNKNRFRVSGLTRGATAA